METTLSTPNTLVFPNSCGNNCGGNCGGNYNGNNCTSSVEHQINNLSNQISTNNLDAGITSVNQNVAAISRDIGRDINGLGRDMITQFNQNALQQLNVTNQILAQGVTNAAAMAHCCCEIKELVREESSITRALITDNRMHDLEIQLASAKLDASQAAQNIEIQKMITDKK